MNERARRIEDLFNDAAELPAEEQTRFLDEHCAGDDDIRREVLALLEAERSSPAGFLTPTPDAYRKSPNDSFDPTDIPESIGEYRVVRCLGRGGMGIVYEAEQSNPKRRVAIKVVRAGLHGKQALRRFEHETHVLGKLQHPGIAHIYGAGTAAIEGVESPYFVMEYIDGRTLDQFTQLHRMDIRSRLELIARVCDAVQYAHQKGVIHRDLKPANILVVEPTPATGHETAPTDTIGQPKVLDFGVARLNDDDASPDTLQTQAGQIVGTLAYMSPEQVSGSGRDLDTRCDVYALGVIAFQTLTGELPLDLGGRSIPDITIAIRDVLPKSAGALAPALRGDVETILAKALEKDRDRRYASAAELAADIRRYLRDEPIIARPPTAMYHLRKFAKRNKGLVAAAAVAVLALAGGFIGVTLALIEAQNQRDAAKEAEKIASDALRDVRDVAAFQGAILENIAVDEVGSAIQAQIVDGAQAAIGPDGTITLDRLFETVNPTDLARRVLHDSILASASGSIGERFAERPLVAAKIRHSLTQTYISLGMPELAYDESDKAYRLLLEHLGEDDPDTIEALMSRAYVLHDLQRLDEAEADYARALRLRLATPGIRGELIADARRLLGSVIASSGRLEEAEAQLKQAIAEFEAAGVSDVVTVQTINALADVYRKTDRPEEARRMLAEAISHADELPESEQWLTLQLSNNLGMLNMQLGHFEDAIATFQHLLPDVRSNYGNQDPRSLFVLRNLTRALAGAGQVDEARTMAIQLIQQQEQYLGPDHPETQRARQFLEELGQ